MKTNRVKIGGIWYKIERVKDLHDFDDDGDKISLHGDVNYRQARIRIEENQCDDVAMATVIHESIHAILAQVGKAYHDEEIVTTLGYHLLGFIRDNKSFISEVINYDDETMEMVKAKYMWDQRHG